MLIFDFHIDALGQMSAFTPTSVYLVDSKPGRSATAVAINNCIRSIAAAIATIFSTQSVEAVGTGVLFSILAAINLVNCLTLVAVIIWGKRWREKFEERTGTDPAATITSDTAITTAEKYNKEMTPLENEEAKSEYNEELAIVHSRMSQV